MRPYEVGFVTDALVTFEIEITLPDPVILDEPETVMRIIIGAEVSMNQIGSRIFFETVEYLAKLRVVDGFLAHTDILNVKIFARNVLCHYFTTTPVGPSIVLASSS